MVQKSCETIDPRIRRTRQMLQHSLEKLLETKDFDQISVQDIAEAATVNRATFYDHYDDKFGLLECMVGSRFHELLDERQVQFDGTCGATLKAMVLSVAEYMTRLRGPDCQRALPPHMESAMIAVVRRILLEGLKQHGTPAGVAPEMVAAAVSWAIYGAVKEWSQTEDRPTLDALAQIVMTLVSPVLHLA